jgi:ADP-ribose pyrophosphatase YjhB (NUDIX family)
VLAPYGGGRHDAPVISFPRIRVAAYVIRYADAGPQLLVFDHVGLPDAGTQVPAGGIAVGEDLSAAVVREVAEETGLTDVEVVTELGTEDRPHPESGLPRRTTYFHLRTSAGTPDAWTHEVTGGGADRSLRFACRFVPLPSVGALADHQDVFLAEIEHHACP